MENYAHSTRRQSDRFENVRRGGEDARVAFADDESAACAAARKAQRAGGAYEI